MRGQGLYREQGIVMRSIRLGEADRIVSVYTQSSGRVRMVAKGARKMKSRFGGRLDAFTHVDLMLYQGRDLDVVSQAEIVGRFPRLRADYPAFTAAAAMADAVERTTPERERNVRLFVLFLGGLRALEAGADDPSLLAHAFLAKATSLAGLHPVLTACANCGGPRTEAFSFSAGGAVCASCLHRSDPRVSPEALAAWGGLIAGDWDTLRAARPDPAVHRELAGLLVGFVQWQMENRFRAFGLLAEPTR